MASVIDDELNYFAFSMLVTAKALLAEMTAAFGEILFAS